METLQNALKSKAKTQLTELYNTREIKKAKELSEKISNALGFDFQLNYKNLPHFKWFNLDKQTVFTHLNPGSDGTLEIKEKNVKEFIENYFVGAKDYPYKRFKEGGEFDNFDYKQALFLSGFPDNGIDFQLKENDLKDRNFQIDNIVNVLTQQLQLELIPYGSIKFKGIFNSKKNTNKIIDIIEPYFAEMLDIITIQERKYVIFGSNQYMNLINSFNEKHSIILEKTKKEGFCIGIKNKAYFSMYNLQWKGKDFFAGIAHTFPNQALPNAFEAMKKYGDECAKRYNEFVATNS